MRAFLASLNNEHERMQPYLFTVKHHTWAIVFIYQFLYS